MGGLGVTTATGAVLFVFTGCVVGFLAIVGVITGLAGLSIGAASASALSSVMSFAGSSLAALFNTCSGLGASVEGLISPLISGCTSPMPSASLPRLISIRSCTNGSGALFSGQVIKKIINSRIAQMMAV